MLNLLSKLCSEPPAASVTLNINNPSFLYSVYRAISHRSACILLTDTPISNSDELRLLSLDLGEKVVYQLKVSGLSVAVNVWAEDKQRAQLKAREVAEKAVRLVCEQENQLATILWELDKAAYLLLTGAPTYQVYQLIADARERTILTFGFHPVALQMVEPLHQLSPNQQEPPDPKTARTILQKIFSWKKQL